jgi:hypothetical protein
MAKNVTFWDWVDKEGRPMRVEYSGWVISPVETQADQRATVIAGKFEELWSIPGSYYSSTYPNNLQMWGEIGARNIDSYVLGPDYFYSIPKDQRKPDEQERADFMLAMFKASKELGIERMNIWLFNPGDCYSNWEGGNLITTGFHKPIVPEYRVIKAIIGPAID